MARGVSQRRRYRLARARAPPCARRAAAADADADGLALRRHRRSTTAASSASARPAGRAPAGLDRPRRRHGLAGLRRHAHPSRQGPYLAALREPRRHFRCGARGGGTRPRGAAGRADDVERRMEFALRCAYAHGTAALRTHLDSACRRSTDLLAGVRARCATAGPAGSSCRRSRSSRVDDFRRAPFAERARRSVAEQRRRARLP